MKRKEMEFRRKRFNHNLDLYLSESDSESELPVRIPKIQRRNKIETVEEEPEEIKPEDRLPFLNNEIFRLQTLCRENFCLIDSLRKENNRLIEIQSELRETTTDLGYALAECPWWKQDEYRNTSFKILTEYTQNIQYILELPTFIDPVEQLEAYGLSKEKAVHFLQRNTKKVKKGRTTTAYPQIVFKCLECKKYFKSENRFKIHSTIHSVGQKKKLGCKECGKNFGTFPRLRNHQKIHAQQMKNQSNTNSNSSNCNFSIPNPNASQSSSQLNLVVEFEEPKLKMTEPELHLQSKYEFSIDNNNANNSEMSLNNPASNSSNNHNFQNNVNSTRNIKENENHMYVSVVENEIESSTNSKVQNLNVLMEEIVNQKMDSNSNPSINELPPEL